MSNVGNNVFNSLIFLRPFSKIRRSVRLKLTLPFVLLAIIFGLAGSYLVSRIVYESLQERYINQIIEASSVAADRIVIAEQTYLETLRLISNTTGVASAVQNQDTEALRQLALPIAINNHQSSIIFLNQNGTSLLEMYLDPSASLEDYTYSQSDPRYAEWTFVQRVLAGEVDNQRDKFAGINQDEWGIGIFVAGPIFNANREQVGVIVVGEPLETLVLDIKRDTFAQTTLYSLEGLITETTFNKNVLTETTLDSLSVRSVLDTHENGQTHIRTLNVGSIAYREITAPLRVRSTEVVGIIGIALPETLLTTTSLTTQIQIIFVVLASLTATIGVGVYLARLITNPLLQLVNVSQEVARGNLKVSVQSQGKDELAMLGDSFNSMVKGLRQITALQIRETKLRSQIEQEREMRELKSRFVSMVSHEFRTPLTTILSSNEYINHYGDALPKDKIQKHHTRINTAIKTMTNLLEDVLVIGKTEAGKLDYQPQTVSIVPFCQEIVDEIQANAGESYKILFKDIDCPQTLSLDPKLMKVALSNLLSNAVKYSPPNSTIKFLIHQKDEKLALKVSDKGIGIPESDQKRLFEAFHRATNVDTIQGTGLGLYITKMVAEVHGGIIRCNSKENHGTQFTIVIPVKHMRN